MTARIGAFPTMLTGLLTGAAGFCGLLLATASTPYPVLAALTFLGGFGTALTMPAATAAAVASAPAGYTGVSGSVINAARQTGSVMGVAVLGSLIASGDFLTGFHRAVAGARPSSRWQRSPSPLSSSGRPVAPRRVEAPQASTTDP